MKTFPWRWSWHIYLGVFCSSDGGAGRPKSSMNSIPTKTYVGWLLVRLWLVIFMSSFDASRLTAWWHAVARRRRLLPSNCFCSRHRVRWWWWHTTRFGSRNALLLLLLLSAMLHFTRKTICARLLINAEVSGFLADFKVLFDRVLKHRFTDVIIACFGCHHLML